MAANVEIVKGVYDALTAGNLEGALGVLDPEISWTEAEGFPYAGTYTGTDAVVENVFARLGSEWDPFRVAASEFIDGGDQVVTLGRYSGMYKATGKSFEADFAHVWTLRDGKAVRFRQYVDSALVQEALR
jgi:ketosteroid isomerase-like protein